MSLFVLNNGGTSMFSAYAKDHSIIFTSYNSDRLKNIQRIINNNHAIYRTWPQQIANVYMFAEDHIQLDLKQNKFCNLKETVHSLDMTYLDTDDETDRMFLYQLTELLNTKIFIVNDYEYKPEVPLLSLVGFFIDNSQISSFDINYVQYLDEISNK